MAYSISSFWQWLRSWWARAWQRFTRLWIVDVVMDAYRLWRILQRIRRSESTLEARRWIEQQPPIVPPPVAVLTNYKSKTTPRSLRVVETSRQRCSPNSK